MILMILEQIWNHFEISLGLCCDRVGIILGSCWNYSGIVWGSFWDRFGIILGSFWDRFGIILGSFWDRFGAVFFSYFSALFFQLGRRHGALAREIRRGSKLLSGQRRRDG